MNPWIANKPMGLSCVGIQSISQGYGMLMPIEFASAMMHRNDSTIPVRPSFLHFQSLVLLVNISNCLLLTLRDTMIPKDLSACFSVSL